VVAVPVYTQRQQVKNRTKKKRGGREALAALSFSSAATFVSSSQHPVYTPQNYAFGAVIGAFLAGM